MKKSNHVQADPYRRKTWEFLSVSCAIDFSEDYVRIVFFSYSRDHEPMYFGVLWDRPHNATSAAEKLCGHAEMSLLCTSGITGVYRGKVVERDSRDERAEMGIHSIHVAPFSPVSRGHVAGLGATVEGESLDYRVVTRAIDFNGEVGAGG